MVSDSHCDAQEECVCVCVRSNSQGHKHTDLLIYIQETCAVCKSHVLRPVWPHENVK